MSILQKSKDSYKPFEYPWAFDFYLKQHQMHWLPTEVLGMEDDLKDFNNKATEAERNIITKLFHFFTQADVDVANGYVQYYLPKFPHPELRSMLLSFASMEAVHVHAYSLLIDTLGFPETEYEAFTEYEEMMDKHRYLFEAPQDLNDIEELAYHMAVVSAFGEGMQLFSSFVILLSFQEYRKMFKGMNQIVTWSIRDETLHVQGMMKIFDTLIKENPHVWTDAFKKRIYEACRTMVELEFKFIDLAFGAEEIFIPKEEIKNYVMYIADRRLHQLGLKANYKIEVNPFPWLDWVLNGLEHTNFFEVRSTEYAKGSTTGTWQDVWSF